MVIRVRRAYCWLFAHPWPAWSPWADAVRERACPRCDARQVECDGREPVTHA